MESYTHKTIDGYTVRPMIQRVWAAQIDVLREIDLICKRHSIRWFAVYGTLLGAVRHKGFIPWDDDIDIGMKRVDFEKFKHYAKNELPKGYAFNFDRSENIKDLVFCIINGKSVNIDEDYLEKHHGCPYPVGVDIYVYDNVPNDPQDRADYLALFAYTFCAAQELESWMTYNDCDDEIKRIIDESERMTGMKYKKDVPLKTSLLILSDQIAAMYYNEKTDYVAIAGNLVKGDRFLFEAKWFADTISLPFESIKVECPVGYEYLLARDYGDDYMTPMIQKYHEHSFVQQEKDLHMWYKEHGIAIPDIFIE